MGFLSKLFGGDKNAEKTALDLLKNLMNSDKKGDKKEEAKPAEANEPIQQSQPAPEDDYEPGPSGFSWGERMPDEENQYNYNGNFRQYFEHIFRDDFPQYKVSTEVCSGGKRVIYTLLDSAKTVCVVEVMHAGSDSKKLRERCRLNGVPYCRFYHNYHGWWNTRKYVVTRINEAIG